MFQIRKAPPGLAHGLARPATASHGLARPATASHGLARPRTASHGLSRPWARAPNVRVASMDLWTPHVHPHKSLICPRSAALPRFPALSTTSTSALARNCPLALVRNGRLSRKLRILRRRKKCSRCSHYQLQSNACVVLQTAYFSSVPASPKTPESKGAETDERNEGKSKELELAFCAIVRNATSVPRQPR
jgi:hypothetical protein